MEYKNILVKVEDAIGVITLNRPKALNALNSELLTELVDIVEKWDADDGVRDPPADRGGLSVFPLPE